MTTHEFMAVFLIKFANRKTLARYHSHSTLAANSLRDQNRHASHQTIFTLRIRGPLVRPQQQTESWAAQDKPQNAQHTFSPIKLVHLGLAADFYRCMSPFFMSLSSSTPAESHDRLRRTVASDASTLGCRNQRPATNATTVRVKKTKHRLGVCHCLVPWLSIVQEQPRGLSRLL